MATLTPVDFDPFAAAAPAPARKLTPVDYDPFASTGSPDAQGSTTPPPTEAPSLLQRLGAGAMGLANLARDPVAPVVEGLGDANLWDAIKRGSASALASTLHTGADVVDQAMLPTRMLYGDNPLGADKVAAQSLAVEKQINADRQAAQAETPRPGLGDLVTNPVEGVRKAAAYYGNTGAESLPMLALALATRNPELGSAMMGAATGAQEYTDLRSQGVPRREAASAGALTGATEKIGESIGLPAVMGKVGSGTLRRAVATEGGQEGLTQLMQQYIDDQATGNQTSIKDQLLGALDAAVVGGALGGGGHVAINVPEMVSALTGRTAGTPTPLPGQVVEPLASTSTPAVAAPVEAAPAPDDLDTMLDALLAGRTDTAPAPAPVPQQVEAPAAAAPASLGEAVAPQMPQAGAMTPADVRAAMDRARVAAEAAQSAPPTPAAPMQAPEASAPVAPKPAPLVDDRASVEALRNEIGWETRGGQLIRGGEVDGDISSGASFGRTSGEVIGRTPWVGKPGPDGESNFWRMRPEQGGKISEKQAHVALDKYAAGQSLNAKERRFIDYARGVAKQYDDAYEADRAQFEQDQADMAEADRVRAVQELRDHQADLSRDDDGEALTLAQWVRRAHDAGVSSEKIIDATWDGSVTEQARRLSRHIADQETNRGTDTRATPIGREGGAGQDQARPAAAGSGVAESTQGFQLEADRPAASIEGARPVASQRGLFAEPTSSDHTRAAIEAKDAQRNGLGRDLVRPEQGDGELLAGPRPTQTSIPDRGSMSPVATNDSVAGKQGSRAAGDESRRDADTGLPLNDDGTVTVYHHTTPEAAEAIRRTGQLRSSGEPDVYVTTRSEPDTGYGDAVVPVRVDPRKLQLDDEFPNGRRDFRLSVGRPGGSVRVDVSNDLTASDRSGAPGGGASANEPKLTDFADEPRQRSIARGNADADRLGLRAAVREALGPVADRVEYLHGYEGLPDKMRRGVESRNALGRKGVTAAMYSPGTGRVFIFTQVTKTPARAVWHAAHEIAGHEGLRALLGDRINPALNIARQNPTVKALADEIYAQRKIAEQMKKSGKTHADGVLLATEEALAELAAAVRTGSYEHINERYGVNVPPGIRESVKAAIANFLRRLKAMIDDLFGKHVFTDQDVRSLLEAAWQAAKGKGKGATASVEHPDGSSSLEQVVFHGTPHTVDKFSLQKIGTGEGAQAYGWGMYFASEKAIAEHYRRGLAERDFINKARNVYDEYDSPEEAVQALRSIGGLSEPQKELIDALQKDDWLGFDYPHQAISAALREPQNFELSPETEAALAKQGNLYRVEVPEDSDLLDWDKPLSEQPEKVQTFANLYFRKRIQQKPLGGGLFDVLLDGASIGAFAEGKLPAVALNLSKHVGLKGRALYEMLAREKGGAQAASETLMAAGIPGLRYLDGGSRNKGQLPYQAGLPSGFHYDADQFGVGIKNGKGLWLTSGHKSEADAHRHLFGPKPSHNYVIWDESAIGQPQSALDSTESAATGGDVQSIPDKGVMDRLQRDAKALADLLEGQSFGTKAGGLGRIEPAVVSKVFAVLQDPQILRAVVRTIPVDVMDLLARKKLTAEDALRNKAVLENMLSSDAGSDVTLPINEAAALVRRVATAAAERTGLTGGALETDGAGDANASNSVLGAHASNDPTKSAAFSRWFGESKVVDASGAPLVVYHGTGASFDTPRGTFFAAEDAEIASAYAQHGGGDHNVMPVYLAIRNPIRVDDLADIEAALGELPDEYNYAYEALDDRRVIERLREEGYDGVYFTGDQSPEANAPHESWLAFDAAQVKSATGNRGTFDPSKPSILESTDYTPEQKEFMRKAGMAGAVDERTAIRRALDGLRGNVPEINGDAFRQGAIDKFHGIKRAVDEKGGIAPESDPYLAAEMIQTASTMEAILRFGAPELHQGALRVKRDVPGLLDALTPVRDQMPQWLGWMVARRAKVLQAQGRENALSDTDIQAGLSLATGHEAEFKQAALGYLKLKNAILDLAEQTGIIDPEARKAWDHAEYIPFYRDMDAGFSGPGTRQGLANQSSGIRTLKGGESPLKDPLGNIIANFTRLVDASMKNRATLLAVDQLGAPYFRKAPLEVKAETIPLDQVRKHLLEQGVDQATIAGMPADALKGVARMLAVKAPEGDDIVRVMRGGKAEYYHVDDPLLLRSLTAFNEGGTHWSLKPLVWFKQLLTAGATATPDFLIRNALRDTGEASVTSKDRFIPLVDTVRGAIDSFRESDLAQDLMMAGAAFHGGLFHTGNNEDTAKAIKRALRKHGLTDSAIERYVRTLINPKRLWDMYRSVSEATEMGSRVSLARKRLAAGATPVEAAHEAKDFLNFQRRGDDKFVLAFTKMIPFLNARVQGADRLYRVGTTKGRRGKVAARLAMMAMLTTLLYWWNQEEHKDAYDEIPDWDKDANWHIAPGTDHHLRIPKPFELGLVGGTVPERMYGALRYQLTNGEDGDRPAQSWDAFMRGLGSALGINPIPQAAMPIVEDIANKSLYFDTPIESMGDRYKAPSDRFGPTTSPTMRAASKGMAALFGEDRTLSPKRLEHFWTGYTAGMGRYLLDGADWVTRKIEHAPETPAMALRDFPLVGTVARGGGPARSTRYVDEFYDLAEQAQVRSGAVKDAVHNGDTSRAARIEKEWGWLIGQREGSKRAKEGFMHSGLRALNRTRDQLSAISKDNARIYADRTMSGEAKRKALDANLEKRNALVRKVVRQLREAERKSRG